MHGKTVPERTVSNARHYAHASNAQLCLAKKKQAHCSTLAAIIAVYGIRYTSLTCANLLRMSSTFHAVRHLVSLYSSFGFYKRIHLRS